MKFNIVMSEAFSRPIEEKQPQGLTANNWDDESRDMSVWTHPDMDMNAGLNLNLYQASRQVNAYLTKNPFELLGGEDKGDEWFKLKATLKAVDLSVVEREDKQYVRIKATINGGVEIKQGSFTVDISLYAEAGIDVLKIEQSDTSTQRIFRVVLDGTKLGWAGAGWISAIPAATIARIGTWMGYEICTRLVVKTFEMDKTYEGIELPLPSASQLFLKGFPKNGLAFVYAKTESGAEKSGQALSNWAQIKRALVSVGIDSGYLLSSTGRLLGDFVNKYGSARKIISKMVEIDSKQGRDTTLKRYKLNTTIDQIFVEGYQFYNNELNLYIGFNAEGNLSVRVRAKGVYNSISFDTGITVTMLADKPKDGVQNIKIDTHTDFADVHLPWWLKLVGFLTRGIGLLILLWVVERLAEVVGKALIDKYGTMSFPNAYAKYAYLGDIGESAQEWWIGANLFAGDLKAELPESESHLSETLA